MNLLLHATLQFRRLAVFLTNNTPENALQSKWTSNPRNYQCNFHYALESEENVLNF